MSRVAAIVQPDGVRICGECQAVRVAKCKRVCPACRRRRLTEYEVARAARLRAERQERTGAE